MSKIDINKAIDRFVQESDKYRDCAHLETCYYRDGAYDMLKKFVPFLETLIENWDSTDMEIFIADEPCDGTQFHITLPEDEAEIFDAQYRVIHEFLSPE